MSLVATKGKKRGARTASNALMDEAVAQRPNPNILMDAVVTLTIPAPHVLLDILKRVKRAREVCKAWDNFLRPDFYKKIEMRIDLLLELGVRFQYDIFPEKTKIPDWFHYQTPSRILVS